VTKALIPLQKSLIQFFPVPEKDEDYMDNLLPDSSEHKPYIDRLPFPGEEIRFPCVEDVNG
jgi:hypothetical protein